MSPRSIVLAGSFLLASLAVGCAAPTDSEDVASGEGAITQAAHAAKVKACIATQDRALEKAVAQNAMNQAVFAARDCIAKANDKTIANIEKNAKEIGSPNVGQVKAQFQAFRDAYGEACQVIADAGDNAGGSLGRLEQAGCLRDREATLAALIDAYVDLGAEGIAIPEDKAAFPQCYADFDKAAEAASNGNEERAAAYGLSECVVKAADALAPDLAKRTLESFPDRKLADVEAAAHAAFAKMSDATATVCGTLADASDNRGGTLSRLYGASCQTDGAAQLVQLAKSFTQ